MATSSPELAKKHFVYFRISPCTASKFAAYGSSYSYVAPFDQRPA